MNKKKIFLTIDFEDWKYDTSVSYSILKNNKINKKLLLKTYFNIQDFIDKNLNGDKITFFCTGILASKFPQIIEEINNNGHEIACHYYNHKNITEDTLNNFEYNLLKSKEKFENITNKPLKGFRAPKFSIYHSHRDYLKIVSNIFKYDSSLNLNSIKDLNKISCEDIDINFFPVFTSKFFFNILKYKPGGTYMKLFPYRILYNNILETFNKNAKPIIYLHPYEFLQNKEFAFNYEELKHKNFLFSLYFMLRQNQWNSGNSFILKKLKKIFNVYESGGKLENLI